MAGQPDSGPVTFDLKDMILTEFAPPVTTSPASIIADTANWRVEANFAFVGGPMATGAVNGMKASDVEWIFSLSAEAMGVLADVDLGSHQGPLSFGQLEYGPGFPGTVPTIDVPAGTLGAGVWKLTGLLTFTDTTPATPYGPIVFVGFKEVVIQVYTE